MDGSAQAAREETGPQETLRVAQVSCGHPHPIAALTEQLQPGRYALVCLFVSPQTDFAALIQRSNGRFGAAEVIACTTAGEIGATGYEDGQILAVGFPADLFSTAVFEIPDLSALNERSLIDGLIQRRMALIQTAPEMPHEFAFLTVDGLSLREEMLTDILASGLGPMPLFGGSAGDGTDFRNTWLAHNGRILQNAALVTMVRTRCPVRVFSHDHLRPTDVRMVVTAADPDNRIVREINAEPAAQEYARLLGKDPHQLGPFTFAAHPVVVRVGDAHHVRSIQRVNDRGELVFFSAINEGMVLSLADHNDIAGHLDSALTDLARGGAPARVLGCDCILRRIAAGQTQQTREISRILSDHRVIGFSTYGEQIGALHVNQTLTGVAIYPPQGGTEAGG